MPIQPSVPSTQKQVDGWWKKLVVSLELADLTDPDTRDRLDSAAAKANNQGLRLAAGWQYAPAVQMLTAAVDIWARLEHIPGEIMARNVRGAIQRKLGDTGEALADHAATLDLARVIGQTGGQVTALAQTGAALVEQGDPDAALAPLTDALALAAESDDNFGTGHTQHFLGRAHEARKDWDAALNAYGSAVEVWRKVVAPAEEIEATAGVARVTLAQGQVVSAVALVEDILRYLGERGPARLDEPLRLYWTIYRVLHMAQQPDPAREMLRAAHDLLNKQALDLSLEQRSRFLDTSTNRAIRAAWDEQEH